MVKYIFYTGFICRMEVHSDVCIKINILEGAINLEA